MSAWDSDDSPSPIVAFLVFSLGLLVASWFYCNASDSNRVVSAAESMGFSDPQIVSKSPLPELHGCSDSDSAAVDVIATNPQGKRVSLVVCCGGLFKGCTVRTK